MIDNIAQHILTAMNEVNSQLEKKLTLDLSETLLGEQSKLDSLGIINLMVNLEEILKVNYPDKEFDLNLPDFLEPLFKSNTNVQQLATAIVDRYLK